MVLVFRLYYKPSSVNQNIGQDTERDPTMNTPELLGRQHLPRCSMAASGVNRVNFFWVIQDHPQTSTMNPPELLREKAASPSRLLSPSMQQAASFEQSELFWVIQDHPQDQEALRWSFPDSLLAAGIPCKPPAIEAMPSPRMTRNSYQHTTHCIAPPPRHSDTSFPHGDEK